MGSAFILRKSAVVAENRSDSRLSVPVRFNVLRCAAQQLLRTAQRDADIAAALFAEYAAGSQKDIASLHDGIGEVVTVALEIAGYACPYK